MKYQTSTSFAGAEKTTPGKAKTGSPAAPPIALSSPANRRNIGCYFEK
jgi:hypothetical protein